MRILALILSILCVNAFAAEEIKGTKEDFNNWKIKAELGDAKAQYYVGCYYGSNLIASPNNAEALKWFHKSAKQGYAEALFSIGVTFEGGILGVEKNEKEAAKWYYESLLQGNETAGFMLGKLYEEGRGVPMDFVEAYAYYNICVASSDKTIRVLGENQRDYFLAKEISLERISIMGQRRSTEIQKEIDARKADKEKSWLTRLFGK